MIQRRRRSLWGVALAMIALQCAGVARASVPVGVTHVVVPCYNEEKRLPIQKFLQFTSDEVCPLFCTPACAAVRTLSGIW
jgi:hypothetical protein